MCGETYRAPYPLLRYELLAADLTQDERQNCWLGVRPSFNVGSALDVVSVFATQLLRGATISVLQVNSVLGGSSCLQFLHSRAEHCPIESPLLFERAFTLLVAVLSYCDRDEGC